LRESYEESQQNIFTHLLLSGKFLILYVNNYDIDDTP
jgi:hypothetical protein